MKITIDKADAQMVLDALVTNRRYTSRFHLPAYMEIVYDPAIGILMEAMELAERKPMNDENDRALCEAYCNQSSDEYFKARPHIESDVGRRIFYAGYRKAWIEREAAHGIKEAS